MQKKSFSEGELRKFSNAGEALFPRISRRTKEARVQFWLGMAALSTAVLMSFEFVPYRWYFTINRKFRRLALSAQTRGSILTELNKKAIARLH